MRDVQTLCKLLIIQQMEIIITCLLEVHGTTVVPPKLGNRDGTARYRQLAVVPVHGGAETSDLGQHLTDGSFTGAFIIPMKTFCQPEREVDWPELDREISQRQGLIIPIQALTGEG